MDNSLAALNQASGSSSAGLFPNAPCMRLEMLGSKPLANLLTTVYGSVIPERDTRRLKEST